MKQKRLFHDASLCDGCGFCQLVCAVKHCRQWNHYQSRIKIFHDLEGTACHALYCAHCQDAPCIMTCLMNTIYKDEKNGVTLRDLMQCIGCRACELACPFDAAMFDVLQEKVVNCDLCGGRPACVDICPKSALSFEYNEEHLDRNRFQAAALKVAYLTPGVRESFGKEGDEQCR